MRIKTISQTTQTNIIITINEYYQNKYFMIFAPINQINKHKVKIYYHDAYTQIIIKKFHLANIK